MTLNGWHYVIEMVNGCFVVRFGVLVDNPQVGDSPFSPGLYKVGVTLGRRMKAAQCLNGDGLGVDT